MSLGNQDLTIGMGLGGVGIGVEVGRRRAGTKEGGVGEARGRWSPLTRVLKLEGPNFVYAPSPWPCPKLRREGHPQ